MTPSPSNQTVDSVEVPRWKSDRELLEERASAADLAMADALREKLAALGHHEMADRRALLLCLAVDVIAPCIATTEATRPGSEVMREALEPSGATKAAYHGEFSFNLYEGVSDEGNDQYRKVYVPWDTIKEIMAAIRTRAALTGDSR